MTRTELERIYDEVDRRIGMYIADIFSDYSEAEIREADIIEYRKDVLQGVYSALIVTVPNWPEIAQWCNEIEEERHYYNIAISW